MRRFLLKEFVVTGVGVYIVGLCTPPVVRCARLGIGGMCGLLLMV